MMRAPALAAGGECLGPPFLLPPPPSFLSKALSTAIFHKH